MPRARSANPTSSIHSIRIAEPLWQAAKRRADSEGITMNSLIVEIIEGYSRGMINMPKVTQTKTYASAAPPAAKSTAK